MQAPAAESPQPPPVPGTPPPLPVAEADLPKRRPWPLRFFAGVMSLLDWLFGLVAILGGLAILAAVPVLNFLSLGYLLECGGRIARTGRFRDGFVGIRKASVIGSIAVCTWIILVPVRLVSDLWRDAQLIDPEGSRTIFMGWVLGIVSGLALFHISWASYRGGRLQHFLWPAPIRFFRWLFGEKGKYRQIRDRTVDGVLALRLPYFFWLGARGFVGGVAWLFLPVAVLVTAAQLPEGPSLLLSLVGIAMLMFVVLYLPFLQVHFARTGRFKALFEVGEVRQLFRRAPLVFWLALLITLLFALPLYLLKIELTPQDLAWLPALFFVVSILPARLLTGWAMSRALRREQPSNILFRLMSRLAAIPVCLVYGLFVWMNQYLSQAGSLGMLEQHAFLVPAPLLGL